MQKILATLKGHSDAINDMNFSPNSKLIVSASSDKSVRLWDLEGAEIMYYGAHKGRVNKAKFSPDGQYILTASDDKTARLMPIDINVVLDKINKEKVRGDVYELSEDELKLYGIE